MPEPSVRARHLKEVLESIDRQPRRGEIRAAVAPGVLAAIEEATGTDWLPVEHDVALANALHAVLGADGHYAFNVDTFQHATRGPLLRALVALATAFFGYDAGRWGSWLPRAWTLIFSECGTMTVERREGEATLTLTGLPPACAGDEVWPRSVASALSSMLPMVKVEGSVELRSIDPAAGTATYLMRWRTGRGSFANTCSRNSATWFRAIGRMSSGQMGNGTAQTVSGKAASSSRGCSTSPPPRRSSSMTGGGMGAATGTGASTRRNSRRACATAIIPGKRTGR